MKVDLKLVDKIAELAKLTFNQKEKEAIREDLEKMIGVVEQLNEMDVSGVEPLAYITDEKNVLRPDVVKQEITHEEALKNAPQKDSDYFKVPKVLKKP